MSQILESFDAGSSTKNTTTEKTGMLILDLESKLSYESVITNAGGGDEAIEEYLRNATDVQEETVDTNYV